MTQSPVVDPYLPDAPWPTARGGSGNGARRVQQAGGTTWHHALANPIVAPPLVGPNGAVWVATAKGRAWAWVDGSPVYDVALGGPVAGGGCLARDGKVLWPLVDGAVVALHADGTEAWRYDLTVERPTPTVLPTRAFRSVGGSSPMWCSSSRCRSRPTPTSRLG